MISVVFKPVKQAQLLNGSQSYPRQNAEIRNNGEKAAQPKTRTLGCGDPHTSMDDSFCDGIKHWRIDRVHPLKAAHRQSISGADLDKKSIGIHPDGLVGLHQRL